MDLGSIILVCAVGSVTVAIAVLAVVRDRRARLDDQSVEQVPELRRAQVSRFSGYVRPGGPESR